MYYESKQSEAKYPIRFVAGKEDIHSVKILKRRLLSVKIGFNAMTAKFKQCSLPYITATENCIRLTT